MADVNQKLAQAFEMLQAGKAEQSRVFLQRVVQQFPGSGDAQNAMAVVLSRLGQFEQAAFFARRAVALIPDDSVYQNTLGAALTSLGRHDEAVQVLSAAVANAPDLLEARQTYANALWETQRCAESIAQLRELLSRDPAHAGALAQLGPRMALLGRAGEVLDELEQGVGTHPDDLALHRGLVTTMLYVPGVGPTHLREAHDRFGGAMARQYPAPPRAFAGTKDPERPLRVGLVSPDFRTHSVMYFVEPILEQLAGEGVHAVVYSNNSNADATTARVKALAKMFRRVDGLSHHELSAQVVADRIDILIDLAGHTIGGRPEVFALRSAPVQATYCGYPATTGIPQIDARLVDAITDPPGSEAWASESLVRLPGCFLCYRPDPLAPDVATPPERPVVFGSFNTPAKLNAPLLQVWARILAAAPGSRLVLKGMQLADASLGEWIKSELARGGVDKSRVDLLTYVRGSDSHLRLYERVDIALDPFPYCGTTTTCEALWMGVPVISKAGEMHHERVGLSLLRAAGLEELSAGSEDEYVSKAVALAGDGARRRELRRTLRDRLRGSALLDAKAHGAAFIGALRALWRSRV